MKKLIFAIFLMAGLVAQGAFISQSLINRNYAKSIFLDATDAGALVSGVTNLAIKAMLTGHTAPSNNIGLIYTNLSDAAVTVAAGTSETINLLSFGILEPFDGGWDGPTIGQITPRNPTTAYFYITGNGTSNQVSEILSTYFKTTMSLVVQFDGKAGVDAATTLTLMPGYYDRLTGKEVICTGGDSKWVISFLPGGLTGRSCICTNVPTYKWPGMERLYLYDITNTDTTDGDQIGILNVDLVTWRK